MLKRLLPRTIDNTYAGQPLGLWLFGLVVSARILQGLAVTFNSYSVAKSADGIPLDTFAPEAARTVVALFALSGVYRLVIALLCVAVLARYRSAVPLMCALLVLEIFAKLILLRLMPFATTGTPPGPVVNLTIGALLIVCLLLALWRRAGAD